MLLEDDPLATRIGEALMARGAKVAVSQTTAGGLISARMLSVAGASRWFESAIVPYSSPTKFEALGMDREMAREHGAVSPILNRIKDRVDYRPPSICRRPISWCARQCETDGGRTRNSSP